MTEQSFDPATSAYADLDGDGYVESLLVDQNTDGTADLAFQDLDRDGIAETAFADTDYDGVADVGAYTDSSGVVHEVDLSGAGAGYSAPPSSDPTGAVGPYPATGDTAATIGLTSSYLADAHTINQEATNPGSVPADELAAAERRAYDGAQNAGQLQGYVHEQGVRTEVHADEQSRRWEDSVRESATETSIGADRAISSAEEATG